MDFFFFQSHLKKKKQNTLLFAGLRRRVTVKKEEKDISKDQCEKEPQFNSKSEKSPSQHQDPLKWFGILVPQNLKQTQAAFKEGKCKTQVYTTIVACKCMSAFFNEHNLFKFGV